MSAADALVFETVMLYISLCSCAHFSTSLVIAAQSLGDDSLALTLKIHILLKSAAGKGEKLSPPFSFSFRLLAGKLE